MKFSATLSYLLYAASVAIAAPIEKRAYSGGDTANDVENGVCAPITLIFARGSTEPGTMGISVGPALAKALISSQGAGKVAVQGVTYTASIASNVEMGAGGGPVMAQLVQKALQQCPDTKIAVSGYSQGAFVVHNAFKHGITADQVSSAVLYGDPALHTSTGVGDLPSSRVKEYCAAGDGVCETGTFAISAAHLSYSGTDTTEGAAFIVQNAGSTSSGSSSSGSDSSSSTDSGDSSSSSSGLGSLGGFSGLGSGSSGLSGLSGLGSLGSSSSGTDSSDGSSSTGTSGTDSSSTTGSSGLSGLSGLGSLSGTSSGSGLGSLSSLGSGSSGLGSLSSLGSFVKRHFA